MENKINLDCNLTQEQQRFIDRALAGENILVDACIGSGKTTVIQILCNILPESLNILYLTYNRLLKLDARERIQTKNTTVTNYHGFAYSVLRKNEVVVGVSDSIQCFIQQHPIIEKYDVLILDEYQDIDLEISQMLNYIKSFNTKMQIIAVGDMEQKIYDKTSLDISTFIQDFLDRHIKLEFTTCFRLSYSLAEKLGRIWKKTIVGVNDNCLVEEMNEEKVIEFLGNQRPEDVLCLGKRKGGMTKTLNILESRWPEKYNKKTVYASIYDNDFNNIKEHKSDNAIFTTYDSCKGLERKICVIFDYTEDYWDSRIKNPDQSYIILRNIFCVASSRGKNKIIFVKDGSEMLSEKTLSTAVVPKKLYRDVNISKMFDFKYKEDIEACYSLLRINCLTNPSTINEINIKGCDELIDLSPCIGVYQEAVFFNNNSLDKYFELYECLNPNFHYDDSIRKLQLEKKVLYYTYLDTQQYRYITQVEIPFVSEENKKQLVDRLNTIFDRNEQVQEKCRIQFWDESSRQFFSARGLADVVKNETVYELKFVSELTHEHYLQCACYMVALHLEKGILWNTRNNQMYEIRIVDKDAFLDAVTQTITKGSTNRYYHFTKDKLHQIHKQKNCEELPNYSIRNGDMPNTPSNLQSEFKNALSHPKIDFKEKGVEAIAIVDVETNRCDNVMSIGAVVANAQTFQLIDKRYYIITPEHQVGGMYSCSLNLKESLPAIIVKYDESIKMIREYFECYNVDSIFAYNVSFDCLHLPELRDYKWHDIMKIAAYKQYNHKIPKESEFCNSGRLKRNYGAEAILRMLSGNERYCEKHNALLDAIDELEIMRLLNCDITVYESTIYIPKTLAKKSNTISNSIQNTSDCNNEQTCMTNLNNRINCAPKSDDKLLEGNNNHDSRFIISEETKTTQPGCYIATAIYHTYDCHQLWTLRRYRDTKLVCTWYGRVFVKIYYTISPVLVRFFGKTKWFNKFFKKILDMVVSRLNKNGIANTPYDDNNNTKEDNDKVMSKGEN